LRHIFHILHQVHLLHPARGALHLRMARMADQHDLESLALVALGLVMHLGHQRAGGVDGGQAALARARFHFLRNPVRRKYRNAALRPLVDFFYEHHALGAQILHYPAVMHDFMAYIDRWAVKLERLLDNFNSAIDPRAESAWRSQKDRKRGWR